MNIDLAEVKTVVKENTVEWLTGSFGDFRQSPKDEVRSAAHEVAYHELCGDWMDGKFGGDEVSRIADEIANELAADCQA